MKNEELAALSRCKVILHSSFKSVQKETKKIVNSPIYTAERLASLKENPYI